MVLKQLKQLKPHCIRAKSCVSRAAGVTIRTARRRNILHLYSGCTSNKDDNVENCYIDNQFIVFIAFLVFKESFAASWLCVRFGGWYFGLNE